MADTADFDGVVRMLRAAASRIEAHHEDLNKLDTAVGDGDHGSAMLRVAGAIGSTLDKDAS
ncbi:MAG: dihydroxyacetone kinase subunit DhaL, partial [Planctomycetota bacterium]